MAGLLAVKIILITAGSLIIAFVLLVLAFLSGEGIDRRRQTRRLEEFSREKSKPASIPDEMIADDTPINRIRYLATHNSSRIRSGPLKMFFLNLGAPGEARKLRYAHLPFSEQLDLGVRSFEFDIRYKRGTFRNIHVPLVDNRSHAPLVGMALAGMRAWSERHPAHVPIIIIFEIKEDLMILDPSLGKWTPSVMLQLEQLYRKELSGRLIVPADVRGNSVSLRAAIQERGWPALSECRGKFILVIHETDADIFTQAYLDDPDRVCFLMVDRESPEASFMLRNDPFNTEIPELIRLGFIVRTRADADGTVTNERTAAAIDSGAQIVSTDYPSGYPGVGTDGLSWNRLLGRR